ncbi:hypothetical protein RSK20926_21075 [Roseobacter sp. SK209-2-6]|nr:hypothetical protein RSK20926_21075 [Roseobacter sp. SK209-2-6]
MILRRLVGRAINAGIDRGISSFPGGRKARKQHMQPETPAEAEARAERERVREIRQARRARRNQT